MKFTQSFLRTRLGTCWGWNKQGDLAAALKWEVVFEERTGRRMARPHFEFSMDDNSVR